MHFRDGKGIEAWRLVVCNSGEPQEELQEGRPEKIQENRASYLHAQGRQGKRHRAFPVYKEHAERRFQGFHAEDMDEQGHALLRPRQT